LGVVYNGIELTEDLMERKLLPALAALDEIDPDKMIEYAVEQVVVRSRDDEAVYAPRITDLLPADRDVVRSFQRTVADLSLFGMLIDPSAKNTADGFEVARSHKLTKGRWETICRALDVDTSGEGGTWVPTGIGADLHAKVRASGKVAPLFARVDIPTNPWKWPVEGADATAYRVAEPTGDTESKFTASTPGTVAATFDAEIFGARVLFSRSLEADSALAILPFVQRKLVQSFVDAEEKAILDGDTDGTHIDSDIGASTTAAVTAWDGLRKRALAETTQATTATTVANLLAIRKSMGKWGVNPADLAYIVGVSGYLALLSDSNMLTVDKMGPNATILNGMVGAVGGVPVIVSEWVRETLNASGVYDGITTTGGGVSGSDVSPLSPEGEGCVRVEGVGDSAASRAARSSSESSAGSIVSSSVTERTDTISAPAFTGMGVGPYSMRPSWVRSLSGSAEPRTT